MIAFLGLGRMGAPMARRLIDTGREVATWNRSRKDGLQTAATVVEAVTGADVVITMLSDPAAAEAGPAGAGAGLKLAIMSAVVPAQVMLAENLAYADATGSARQGIGADDITAIFDVALNGRVTPN